MQNPEKNSPEQLPDFDRMEMEDAFRIYSNYMSEHSAANDLANDLHYSVNESRGLACKMALWADNIMPYFEAIDRVLSTINYLVEQMEHCADPEKSRNIRYMVESQINILGLFSWMEAYGPRIIYDPREELKAE